MPLTHAGADGGQSDGQSRAQQCGRVGVGRTAAVIQENEHQGDHEGIDALALADGGAQNHGVGQVAGHVGLPGHALAGVGGRKSRSDT